MLSDDYFKVEAEDIQWIESVLTVLGGKVVYAGAEFKQDDPPLPPASPTWSPVKRFGGQWRLSENRNAPSNQSLQSQSALCECASSCGIHGHSHAWMLDVPVNDKDKNLSGAHLGARVLHFK